MIISHATTLYIYMEKNFFTKIKKNTQNFHVSYYY